MTVYHTARETVLFEWKREGKSIKSHIGSSLAKMVQGGAAYLRFILQDLEKQPQSLFVTEAGKRDIASCAQVCQWFASYLKIFASESNSWSRELASLADASLQSSIIQIMHEFAFDIDGFEILDTTIDLDSLSLRLQPVAFADLQQAPVNFPFPDPSRRFAHYLKHGDGSVTERRICVRCHVASGCLPIEDTSSGFKRMLALSFLLMSEQGTFIIDDLDQNLHPLLTQRFIERFLFQSLSASDSRQLVFTTHDTHLLDANLFRRDEVLFMEKDSFGASHLVNLAEFKVIPGLNIEKGYLNGRFGAIPLIK